MDDVVVFLEGETNPFAMPVTGLPLSVLIKWFRFLQIGNRFCETAECVHFSKRLIHRKSQRICIA